MSDSPSDDNSPPETESPPNSPGGALNVLKAAGGSINPLPVLREAIEHVPAVKFAFGVLGIVAAATIALKWFGVAAAVFAPVVAIGLMVLLAIFAALAERASFLRTPAIVLTWASLVIGLSVLLLLTSSAFFNWPLRLRALFEPAPRIVLDDVVVTGAIDQEKNLNVTITDLPKNPFHLQVVFRPKGKADVLTEESNLTLGNPRIVQRMPDPNQPIEAEIRLFQNDQLISTVAKDVVIEPEAPQ